MLSDTRYFLVGYTVLTEEDKMVAHYDREIIEEALNKIFKVYPNQYKSINRFKILLFMIIIQRQ